jgi:superfamily I DNA/RNA helicase
MAMLEGLEIDDLDGESEGNNGYTSLLTGPKPEVQRFSSHADEAAFLGKRLKELLKERAAEDICLVARTNKIVRECYQPMLKSLGLSNTLLDNKGKEESGIRLATMHRVKGLEFPVMILAGINASCVPLRLREAESDSVTKADHEYNERCLLFVAATRARDLLLVTSWGKPSPFLSQNESD